MKPRKSQSHSTSSPRRKGSLEKVLVQVRNLVERLNSGAASDEKDEADELSFFRPQLGGLRLTGSFARQYREALESLLALHGVNADIRPLSGTASEEFLRTVLLRTLRPKHRAAESRGTFKRRLDREMRRFQASILSASEEWNITVEVFGFEVASLPFQFGGVDFVVGSPDEGRKIASALGDFEPARRIARKLVAAERKVRETERARIIDRFSNGMMARTTVRAVDAGAAKHLGVERIKRTIDVLNFFAPFFHRRPTQPRAFIAPDAKRSYLMWTVRPTRGESFHWNLPDLDWGDSANEPITMIRLDSPRAAEIGLVRASEIMAMESPSDFHTRTINALSWAGRACAESRRDLAFLLFTISLEALLTKPAARGGVTDRLRLRMARLIGLVPETRKQVFERMARIYEVRSALVHAGDSTELTEADLTTVRRFAQYALTGVLIDPRFTGIQRATDFERYLDEQLFT